MKYLISVLFTITSFFNTYAFTVPTVYNTGKLINITKEHYLIQTKSKKYIKVKPFLNNPKVGIQVTYPISTTDIAVSDNYIYQQALKMLPQSEYTSDIIEAYLKTLAEVSRNGLYKVESTNGGKYSFNFVIDMLIPTACAEGQECNNMCYFGGWASTRKGSYCQAPWKVSGLDKVQSVDSVVYTNSYSCGGKNLFRCNPKIFGGYDSSLDPLPFVATKNSKRNSEAGICIKVSPSYAYATSQCLEASAKVPNFKESLKERYNNNKETFEKIIDNVNCFCEAKSTPKKAFSCNALKERLATIFEKPEQPEIPKVEEKEPEPTPEAIPVIPRDDDGREKAIPREADGGDEEKFVPVQVEVEQEEELLPDDLIYYNCNFDSNEKLFEGKNANCSNKGVCLKKLICEAHSEKQKKFDIKSKLLAYCPCDENDATQCANAKADKAIRTSAPDSSNSSSAQEQ
ncbi:hypothetical protein ABMA70_07270 [Halobacteriovorax sp. XZX-3]|uniref:hypothetical protein n=1 Tax=unclassified Halobacteriovorax TaxID=2639665 RepID=UPI00371FF320